MRYSLICLLFCMISSASAQDKYKYEREYRIKKSQFPEAAHALIQQYLEDARRIRFYRETDSAKVSFEAKFKQGRLHYSVEFNQEGELEDVEILIKEVDIPNESFNKITEYLETGFTKFRIRRIQQQYPVSKDETIQKTLNDAFQNLILPTIRYELIVAGKKENGFEDFEILFDADGGFLQSRKSLPANYDHILY